MERPPTDPDDAAIFKRLFEAYFDRLFRYAYRYLESADEAQDLVHDIFLTVWRQRRSIGLQRDLRTYLYVTTRNRALDRLRRRKVEARYHRRRAAAEAAEPEAELAPDPAAELESRERAAAIQQAIDALPARQREVLRLRWEAHLSYNEVAEALGISPKTVAVHLTRALAQLRQALPGLLE